MEQRFLSKVNKTPTCWLWTAYLDNDGYGKFWIDGRNINAHRVAYELWKGQIPDGMVMRHACDEPSCVNPEHLLFGTQADNIRDKVERGRQARGDTHRSRTCPELTRKGQNHHNSKITDDEVTWIRVLRGFYKNVELAKMYGMTPTSMSKIVLGRSYKHII
jgi:hypothetical protein